MPDKTSAIPGPILDKYMRTPAVDAAPKVGFRIRLFNLPRGGRSIPAAGRQNLNTDKIMSDTYVRTYDRLRIRDSALQYGKVSPENRQGREDGASGTQPVKALDFRHTVPTGQEEREFELLGRSVDRRRLRVLGSGQ